PTDSFYCNAENSYNCA
ncbi:hypothetical protein N499_0373B, partial [Wolbachia pipientis wVitA]